MQRRTHGRWWGTYRALLLIASVWGWAGCSSTKAAKGTGGSGDSIAQGQCGPGDTTESCCLKTNPGQYERCGAIPPRDRPNPLLPRLPTEEERKEWDERCTDHYARCKDSKEGERPSEANEKPCPGG